MYPCRRLSSKLLKLINQLCLLIAIHAYKQTEVAMSEDDFIRLLCWVVPAVGGGIEWFARALQTGLIAALDVYSTYGCMSIFNIRRYANSYLAIIQNRIY